MSRRPLFRPSDEERAALEAAEEPVGSAHNERDDSDWDDDRPAGLGIGAGAADDDDEEDDYMSDALIAVAERADDRQRSSQTYSERRRAELSRQKERGKTESVKVIEARTRAEGLATPLGTDNKGFAIMAKMGYTQGSGLGAEGSGRIDPIEIRIRQCASVGRV